MINLQMAEFVRSAAKKRGFSSGRTASDRIFRAFQRGKVFGDHRLLGRKNFARVGSAPGKTTHINYFKIDGKFYLVDLPGYGYAKVSQAEKAGGADSFSLGSMTPL